MPKVLRILNRFNLGGPTYNAAYLSKYLPDNYETLLIGGEKDDSEASSTHITDSIGLKPRIIGNMKRSISFSADRESYKEIRQIIREFKPDIVHTHASKAGAVGRLAAIHENVPVIVHTFHGHVFHGYFNPIKTAIYKVIERRLAAKSDQIVTISDIQKQEICEIHKICPTSKSTVIPLGFDLDRFQENKEANRKSFRAKYHLAENTVAVGIIGRLVPIKNHSLYLKGIAHCKAHSNQKFQAFIIGDGESRQQIETEATNLNLTFDNKPNPEVDIVFTSWITEVDKALPGLDIVALTSLNEGTPVSLIEAQAAERAIVSTNVGGIENVVLKNKSALLSAIEDEDKFGINLLQLIDEKELRESFSKAGKDFVFKHFHYKVLVKNMTKLYDSLLTKKGISH